MLLCLCLISSQRMSNCRCPLEASRETMFMRMRSGVQLPFREFEPEKQAQENGTTFCQVASNIAMLAMAFLDCREEINSKMADLKKRMVILEGFDL